MIRGMEEQYRKDYPITATVAPLMASAPVLSEVPGRSQAWRNRRKQPHAQHGGRCGNCGRIRVSLRLASLRAAGAIF